MPQLRAKFGEKKRRRRLTEEEKRRIIDYRKEGRSYTEISVLMGGLPISTIERYARTVKRGQSKTEPQGPAVSEPQTPPWETTPTEVLPPKEGILPDWYYQLQDIANGDYETPIEMLDAVLRVIPPVSDMDKLTWTAVIKTAWERRKGEEETAKFVQDLIDTELLVVTTRRYPEQPPQIIESMQRGDKILARLDEMILLLKELLKGIKRREL
jgi:hypothetical protein